MAHYMPPLMLALFAPRPPLEFKPPMEVYRKRPRPYTGLAAFKDCFKDPNELKPLEKHETAKEKKERRKKRKVARGEHQVQLHAAQWKPHEDEKATKDPYKTLFLGRLPYSATEESLRKEVERCGPVRQIRVVTSATTNKPRGYAFVEFEDAKDFKYAYRALDGIKMDNRRIIADVERGRTVPDWKPRKLGGGLGATRNGEKKPKGSDEPKTHRNGGGFRSQEGHRDRGFNRDRRGGRGRDDYDGRDVEPRGDDRRREYSRRDDNRDRGRSRDKIGGYGGGGYGGGSRRDYGGDRPRYDDGPARYDDRQRRSTSGHSGERRRSYDGRGRDFNSRRY